MNQDFSRITIVSVDGRPGGNYRGALLAIQKSMQELPGAKGLILTPDKPAGLPAGISHDVIPTLDYQTYSFFVVYLLHHHVSTDFALLVQEDGWVLNGKAWREEFWDYDYIGAPIHLARIISRNGESHLERGFSWVNNLKKDCLVEPVLNGGFSLRSRSLLAGPKKYNLPFLITPPEYVLEFPRKIVWPTDFQNEDVQLCIPMRQQLGAHGFRFATLDVAKFFAIEHLAPEIWDGVNFTAEILGHHSRFRKITSLSPLTFSHSMRPGELISTYGEEKICQMFRGHGYENA